MSLIEINGATCDYRIGGMFGGSVLKALRGIDLTVRDGEILALVGESGCGKSTLSRLLLGIEVPSAGSVMIAGRSISSYGRLERARLIQPIFQDPYSSLNPRLTVERIIAAPLEVQGIGTVKSRLASVHGLMDAVGLARYLAGAYSMQLSGGQRQRVAIARALICEPKILICDEPTSALDVSVQAQILNLIASLHKSLGLTILLITHNLAVVSHLADRVAVMYLGRIVELGTAADIFSGARHPYTAELLRAILRAEPGTRLPELALKGEFPSPTAPPPGCAFNPRCAHASELCRSASPAMSGEGARGFACHHPLS